MLPAPHATCSRPRTTGIALLNLPHARSAGATFALHACWCSRQPGCVVLLPGRDGRRVVVRAADVAGHLLLLLLLLLLLPPLLPPLLLLAQLAAMRPGLPRPVPLYSVGPHAEVADLVLRPTSAPPSPEARGAGRASGPGSPVPAAAYGPGGPDEHRQAQAGPGLGACGPRKRCCCCSTAHLAHVARLDDLRLLHHLHLLRGLQHRPASAPLLLESSRLPAAAR
jgi:hypothetical protein